MVIKNLENKIKLVGIICSAFLMGCIIIFALSFAVIKLIVDLIYGFIDPRIKAQYK